MEPYAQCTRVAVWSAGCTHPPTEGSGKGGEPKGHLWRSPWIKKNSVNSSTKKLTRPNLFLDLLKINVNVDQGGQQLHIVLSPEAVTLETCCAYGYIVDIIYIMDIWSWFFAWRSNIQEWWSIRVSSAQHNVKAIVCLSLYLVITIALQQCLVLSRSHRH